MQANQINQFFWTLFGSYALPGATRFETCESTMLLEDIIPPLCVSARSSRSLPSPGRQSPQNASSRPELTTTSPTDVVCCDVCTEPSRDEVPLRSLSGTLLSAVSAAGRLRGPCAARREFGGDSPGDFSCSFSRVRVRLAIFRLFPLRVISITLTVASLHAPAVIACTVV